MNKFLKIKMQLFSLKPIDWITTLYFAILSSLIIYYHENLANLLGIFAII